MTLVAAIAAEVHTAHLDVRIGGRPVNALEAEIRTGFETVSAQCTLRLATVPTWVASRQLVEVRTTYNTFGFLTRFVGWITADNDEYWPYTEVIQAAGRLRLTQERYPSEVTYSSQTDGYIIEDLLERVGITAGMRNIADSGHVFGAVQDVVLPADTPPWQLIEELDLVTGYRTFDLPDGTVLRMQVSGLPTPNVVRVFTDGYIFEGATRERQVDQVYNKVTVKGLLGDDGSQPSDTRQADNTNVPDPPRYRPLDTFTSSYIETDEYAQEVAARNLASVNRVPDVVRLPIAGDPTLHPGQTIGVDSEFLRMTAQVNYWLSDLLESFTAEGYFATVQGVGGLGDAGYSTEVDPIVAFTWYADGETVGGSDLVSVHCDGSSSMDPDGAFETLTFSWENSANADVGTDVRYATSFTPAEIAAGVTVTLTVVDADGNSSTSTQTITAPATTLLYRELFVAADAQAEETPDGGANWRTDASPAGSVAATPELAYSDGEVSYTYFGAGDELFHTADGLQSALVLVHDFTGE